MPVRVYCPHCISACLVADKHLGGTVRCQKCGQTFTAHRVVQGELPSTEPIPATAGALRMGIAGLTSTGKQRSRNEDTFLIQQLTWFENQNYQQRPGSCPVRGAIRASKEWAPPRPS